MLLNKVADLIVTKHLNTYFWYIDVPINQFALTFFATILTITIFLIYWYCVYVDINILLQENNRKLAKLIRKTC